MKIIFRILRGGSGNDVFFNTLFNKIKSFNTLIKYNSPFFELFPELILLLPKLRENPNLIHSNIEYAWAFKKRNIPLVVTVHHNVFDPLYQAETTFLQKIFHSLMLKRNIKRSLDTADKIIAVSKYTRDSIMRTFGNYQIDVIYNGIETDKFRPLNIDKRVDQRCRLLFVGNLIRRKGADLLPKIMEKLGDDYVLYYTSGLRSKVPSNFKRSNMISLGRLSDDDLVLEYNKCDIFLFPTRLEGFGYAVAEAMACGKPIVATNCSSIPELVEDGKNGLLCEMNNVDDFVRKCRQLFSDKQLREIMGIENRTKLVNLFSILKNVRAYEKMYFIAINRVI